MILIFSHVKNLMKDKNKILYSFLCIIFSYNEKCWKTFVSKKFTFINFNKFNIKKNNINVHIKFYILFVHN